jgi:hypothetical protein
LGYIQCCWTKSGNLAVATALVDLSATGLISWFNSCAAVHALARMGCQQSEQLMATLAELGAYPGIIILSHLIILFCREFALHGVDLLPLAHALDLGTMARPHKQGPALYFPREITLDLRSLALLS